MTPERSARHRIDVMLTASGWDVQDYKAGDFSAGRGIVLREVPLTTGPCDYLLLVDRKAVGAAQPNISPGEIEEMPVPLPPLAEQTRIVAEVDRRLSVVEELESVASANLQRATASASPSSKKPSPGSLCEAPRYRNSAESSFQ